MLWPSRTIRSKAGSRPSGSYICLRLPERVAQAGGGDRDRHAGRVHVEHELVLLLDHRVAQQLVEHRDPGQRAGDQPVDHDHRDLARLVGADQQQVGPLEVLLGPEQARSIDSDRGRCATTCRPAESSGRSRAAARRRLGRRRSGRWTGSISSSVQTRASRLVDLGIPQPRVGDEERRQREGHLGRVEPLLGCALALLVARLADRDQRHAQPVLVIVAVEAADLEIEARRILWMSAGCQGESCEDELELLLAAVELERDDLAVLRLDLAPWSSPRGSGGRRRRCRAPSPAGTAGRTACAPGPGPGRGRRGSRRHRRRRRGSGRAPAACASGPAASPRSRRARPGHRPARARACCWANFSMRSKALVDVAAILALEVVPLERLERPLGGTVEARDAAVGRRGPIAAAGLDLDVRPAQQGRDQDGQLSQRHDGSLPRPTTGHPPGLRARDRLTNHDDRSARRSMPIGAIAGRLGGRHPRTQPRPGPCAARSPLNNDRRGRTRAASRRPASRPS